MVLFHRFVFCSYKGGCFQNSSVSFYFNDLFILFSNLHSSGNKVQLNISFFIVMIISVFIFLTSQDKQSSDLHFNNEFSLLLNDFIVPIKLAIENFYSGSVF